MIAEFEGQKSRLMLLQPLMKLSPNIIKRMLNTANFKQDDKVVIKFEELQLRVHTAEEEIKCFTIIESGSIGDYKLEELVKDLGTDVKIAIHRKHLCKVMAFSKLLRSLPCAVNRKPSSDRSEWLNCRLSVESGLISVLFKANFELTLGKDQPYVQNAESRYIDQSHRVESTDNRSSGNVEAGHSGQKRVRKNSSPGTEWVREMDEEGKNKKIADILVFIKGVMEYGAKNQFPEYKLLSLN